jgi:hypothetical protein
MSQDTSKIGAASSVLTIGIKAFLQIAATLTPRIPILLIGDHGKGKSAAIYQAAARRQSSEFASVAQATTLTKLMSNDPLLVDQLNSWHRKFPNLPAEWKGVWHKSFGLPVIERRLSQIQSGELNGLPQNAELGTIFNPMQWLAIASKVPCFLFLDELNRATRENEQGCFQLTDSRCIGTCKLHPETMIAAAANAGNSYDVSTPDPAALSRFAVWKIDPSLDEWFVYIQDRYPRASEVVAFLKNYSNHVESNVSMDPWFKAPDRRAWERVLLEAEAHNLFHYDTGKKIPDDDLVFAMGFVSGIVGFPAANTLLTTLNEGRESVVTPEMCFKHWGMAKTRLPSGGDRSLNDPELSSRFVTLSEGICSAIKTQELDDNQIEQLKKMMAEFPPELAMKFFSSITERGGSTMDRMLDWFPTIMPIITSGH